MLEVADSYGLTLREALVLQHIIRQYIETANPVGSRTVSKQIDLNLSPASIRNIMADLEEKGLIGHPHTSAGRVPTDNGYRCYVDSIMHRIPPDDSDLEYIGSKLDGEAGTPMEELIRKSSRILSAISHQLAIVSVPLIGNARIEHMELVPVSSTRVMVVLSISSGIVKTIIFEIDSEVSRAVLQELTSSLNERFGGLSLREIRETFSERMREAADTAPSLIELFIQSGEKLFADELNESRVYIDGIAEVTQQPEFGNPERLRDMIEIIENRNVIIHLLDSIDDVKRVTIRIGSEIGESKFRDYSLITAPYELGAASGTISIIGPRRMDYPRLISIVDYIAKYISREV